MRDGFERGLLSVEVILALAGSLLLGFGSYDDGTVAM